MIIFLFVETRVVENTAVAYIRSLGMSPVLLAQSASGMLYEGVDLEIFDGVHHVDTRDAASILSLIREQQWNVGAVWGTCDAVMISASLVARALGLPHPSVEGLVNAYRKNRVRELLADRGYEQPAWQCAMADDFPAIPDVPFPLVIKPVRDAGAYGVSLCLDMHDYARSVEAIRRGELQSLRGDSYHAFLIEQFVDGPFYGAELIHFCGAWHVVGFNRIGLPDDGGLCMTSISHPADFSAAEVCELSEMITAWVDAVGLRGGALNVEFKITADGPRLIEVNLRVAGLRVVEQVLLTQGIDMIAMLVDFSCGRPVKEFIRRESKFDFIADALVFIPEGGTVEAVHAPVAELDYVSSHFKQVPFTAPASQGNFGAIVGHVFAHGRSSDEAMGNARRLAKRVTFEMATLGQDSQACNGD
jgi:biotin carboxylase